MSNTDLDYIYLASPYNHPDEELRYKRVEQVGQFGFDLTEAGFNVFCPITQSFNLQNEVNPESKLTCNTVANYFPRGRMLAHKEWMRVDLAFLSKAKVLVVYCLDGWEKSRGVQEEIEFAKSLNIPRFYARPDRYKSTVMSDLKAVLTDQFQEDDYYVPLIETNGAAPLPNWVYVEKDRKASINEALAEGMKSYAGALKELAKEERKDKIESIDKIIAEKNVFDSDDYDVDKLQLDKGVKREQAKAKVSVSNFPWYGYGHKDNTLQLLGECIQGLIMHPETLDCCGYYFAMMLRIERLMLKDRYQAHKVKLECAKVFQIGQEKHGLQTHQRYEVSDIPLLVEAIGRHILKGLDNKDEESGCRHRAHVLANVYMIKGILRRGK